ncbi:MFS transporter [Streptomyces sp. NPDC126499]
MPVFLHVLGLAVFAQGTSEFMLSGLVPDLAHDLHVSTAAAGGLTSAYAIGMIVGAPLTAALSARWPRRPALAGFLAAFVLVHVVGALATDFVVLFATRVVAAVVNAGFLAVALPFAAGLVEPPRRARATAVLLSGVTLACVVGVPAGALLGETYGWRSAFWSVAALCLPALALVLRSPAAATPDGPPIPDAAPTPDAAARPEVSTHPDAATGPDAAPGPDAPPRPDASTHPDTPPRPDVSVRRDLGVLASRPLRTALGVAALVNGATFATFAFLAVVAEDVARLPSGAVPGLLAAFGAGAFLGVTAAGRMAPGAGPGAALRYGRRAFGALTAGWVLLALTAVHPVTLFLLAAVQGALSFGLGTALVSRVLRLASGAPVLAGAFATVGLNTGAFAGPLLAAAATGRTGAPVTAVWTSAVLAAAAALLTAVDRARSHRRGKTTPTRT